MRLLFTLGNLTAKSDEARQQLFQCKGCTDTLLHLYDSYQRRDVSPRTRSQKGAPLPSKPPTTAVSAQDDVLVKLVRVLANMCIHPAVGPALAANTTCIRLLMETLGEHRAGRTHLHLIHITYCMANYSRLHICSFNTRFVFFCPHCISVKQRKQCVKIGVSDRFKNSCLVHCKYSKYLQSTQPLPLCWEQDMTLVENTLLICLFIPSLAFLLLLSAQYAAHPLLV